VLVWLLELGSPARWDRRFRIDLPPDASPGPHVLAIKVLDRALKGGVWKGVKWACDGD
jgi:hypothetical protein